MIDEDEVEKDMPISTIGEDIVKSFHEQFAQNQNHHQNLFIQTLAILLSVLIGYGYLYIRIGSSSDELSITMQTLYAFLTIAMYLLTIAIALLANMALGFRRDQLMAANIRIKSNVMTPGSNENYFFSSFNPYGKTKSFVWMPEFHFIFFISLFITKILLLVITLRYENHSLGLLYSEYMFYLNISLVSFLFDFLIEMHYQNKWKKHSDDSPARLKS